jgi:DNA-binding CsgD family transcriptional regulator
VSMSNSSPPFQIERRNHLRRAEDRTANDLHKTFSTPHCHSCLERMADGVLLLDCEMRVIFATPQVTKIMQRQYVPFELSPKFKLKSSHHELRFADFINGKNQEKGPLSFLWESESGHYQLLINCFLFPKPDEPNLSVARYMITLNDPSNYSSRNWLQFIKQFQLTPAEARLCRMLADGLIINDYCEKWKVASSTARSQLHNIFGKTSTHRQSDLLRLIFLFSRA